MRQAIAPKLGAVQNVADAAPADPLGASLLFSSVSAIAGNSGHANYNAANAVLDAFAAQQADTGAAAVAVQWGAWAAVGAWPERGGCAAGPGRRRAVELQGRRASPA